MLDLNKGNASFSDLRNCQKPNEILGSSSIAVLWDIYDPNK